jgi:hypothetical protein
MRASPCETEYSSCVCLPVSSPSQYGAFPFVYSSSERLLPLDLAVQFECTCTFNLVSPIENGTHLYAFRHDLPQDLPKFHIFIQFLSCIKHNSYQVKKNSISIVVLTVQYGSQK